MKETLSIEEIRNRMKAGTPLHRIIATLPVLPEMGLDILRYVGRSATRHKDRVFRVRHTCCGKEKDILVPSIHSRLMRNPVPMCLKCCLKARREGREEKERQKATAETRAAVRDEKASLVNLMPVTSQPPGVWYPK